MTRGNIDVHVLNNIYLSFILFAKKPFCLNEHIGQESTLEVKCEMALLSILLRLQDL